MKTTLSLATVLLTMLAVAPAEARSRCGSVTTRTAPVTFRDTSITAYGASCRRARQVVAALGRRRTREFNACAVPIGNGGQCDVLGYACTVGQAGRRKALRGSCQSLTADLLIEFNEVQHSRG